MQYQFRLTSVNRERLLLKLSILTLRVAQFFLKIARLAMEPRGLGLAISTPIMAPVQISKKQTVVGNTCFKVFFLSLPILNLISNSIIVLGLVCWKSHMGKLHLNCYFLVQGLPRA